MRNDRNNSHATYFKTGLPDCAVGMSAALQLNLSRGTPPQDEVHIILVRTLVITVVILR